MLGNPRRFGKDRVENSPNEGVRKCSDRNRQRAARRDAHGGIETRKGPVHAERHAEEPECDDAVDLIADRHHTPAEITKFRNHDDLDRVRSHLHHDESDDHLRKSEIEEERAHERDR